MAGLYDDAFIERLRHGAQAVAPAWGLSAETAVRLLTVSENATFRADDPARADPVILRVHRPGYHTRAEIESELAWIDALRADGVVSCPASLNTLRGERLATFSMDGDARTVAAFAFMAGTEPQMGAELARGFHDLGAVSARLHAHARAWTPPPGFVRKRWDFDTTVGPRPHWGDWRAAPGLTPEGQAVLERLCDHLQARLAAFGDGPERFGLIHADLRLANLLIDQTGRIGVIDFDDCGFGWFLFDFAAAVSFFEHDPAIPLLQDAWVQGYRSVAPLSDADVAMLPDFVMLRRLQLTAWIASHAETPTARAFGDGYTLGAVALAKRHLAG